MMSYPNQTGPILKTEIPQQESEIASENRMLGQAIQSAFDGTRLLSQRLQPVLIPQTPTTEANKEPESLGSDIGSTLRSHRQSVEEIAATIQNLLKTLAI